MSEELRAARRALRIARAQFRIGGHPGAWERYRAAQQRIRELAPNREALSQPTK